ncbi:PH domain-containing protein [Psychroserpens sp. SPM9]|uniref:PH domain-containing protein n=1 Tax=Psychroserpens sp. SPM9 TaxID=2975598 RepID=UPI0021A70DEC|nr:PH domain-containing protein [Psychroserpens sp. SPM9]MDG5491551.1 PH domain-containing protein [Psychroserpens sp. SPM9]
MKITDFSQPIRQSSKGIIIIFAFNAFKFFKRFFVLFIAFGLSLSKKKSFANLTLTNLILICVGILVVLLIIAVLKYLNFKFHLSKDDFHLSTGIFNKDNTIIPKSKIQNVYIKQNFLQQIINVVSLNIETAGDTKSEIQISALDKPTALRLKSELFQKAKQIDVQTEVTEAENVFFRVSIKRLLLEGISQNHLRSFAIIASFVFGLYYEFKDYVEELRLRERLEDIVHLDQESVLNIILLNLVGILAAVIISLLFSVIKTVITNFNLEVIENQKTIEINKGLINKVSLSLTPSRIQNIVIKTNRVKRYFGLHTLFVKQAMVNAKQRKNFVIIALEQQQVKHLVNKLLVNYSGKSEAFKPKPYYKRIMALRAVITVGLLTVLGVLIFGRNFWWITGLLLILSVLYVWIGYKKAYYKIDEDYVSIGGGVIDTTTNILEINKIQAVKLRQTIFQKRHKIASVFIATASKTVKIPYILENDAKSIANFLLFKVESQHRDWM